MKKRFFFAAMAAFAMVSCSNDEVLEINKGRAIDFRTAMQTRATEITTQNLQKFFVTAFNDNKVDLPYFENVEFTKGTGENENYFVSQDTYYYPGDGTDLKFYAYAPAMEGYNIVAVNKNITLTDFAPAVNIKEQVDFITARASGNKNNTAESVSLKFDHNLSQIAIWALQQSNNVYIFEVKGVRIAQAVSKGSFEFNNSAWELSENKATYEYLFDEVVTINAQTPLMEEDNAMLIPQQLTKWDVANDKENTSNGAYISLLMRITTTDGALVYPFKDMDKEYAWAAIPVGTELLAGKKYIYHLNFADGAGFVDPSESVHKGEKILNGEVKFDVEVTGWEGSNHSGDMGTGDVNEDLGETDTEDPFGDF